MTAERRPPVRLVIPREDATASELAKATAEALREISASVNGLGDDMFRMAEDQSRVAEESSRTTGQMLLVLNEVRNHGKQLAEIHGMVEGLKLGPMRAEEISRHDWTEILTKAGAELTARVKDPRDQLTSERAKAIAETVVADAGKAARLAAWDARVAAAAKLAGKVITYLTIGVVGWLIHRLMSGH